ncbi:hypothetical protein N0V95_003615 [Ascochyta clinopodiicola]|nr:hypothetical protein N0V95_003615 [Ascochyta clinopodiicola]
MATSKVYMATGGVTGTYINLFPYKAFFELQTNKYTRECIGWGYKGPYAEDPLLEFKRNEKPWWTQIPPREYINAPEMFLNEIKKIAQEAKFPDKVNIFFFCYGSDQESLSMGGHKLTHAAIDELTAKEFNYGVQVNLVVAACFSGLLEEKIKNRNMTRRTAQTSVSSLEKSYTSQRGSSGQYRGSPFVAAYASSLVQGLEKAKTETPGTTLQEHFDKGNTIVYSSQNDEIIGEPDDRNPKTADQHLS